jgi:hypothetical protein
MDAEQQDLLLSDKDAEAIVGGKKTAHKTVKDHPGYVPGDTHVVNPSSSGMAGDTSATDDEC